MTKQIYFIALIPPPDVTNEITVLRKKLLPGFNMHSEHKKFPHITLQHTFRRTSDIEDSLSDHLKKLAAHYTSFSVTANDFGSFDRRTVFIEIKNNAWLQELYLQVNTLLKEKFAFPGSDLMSSFHPHITLEKQLTPAMFNQAWNILGTQSYSSTFRIKYISLLKHDGSKWQPLRTFNFRN